MIQPVGQRISEPEKLASKRRRSATHDFGVALLVTVVGVLASIGFEHTSLGQASKAVIYAWLQGILPTNDAKVVVVDIGDVDKEGEMGVTSRSALIDIVNTVRHYRPKALGVDIDMSPDNGQYCSPRDQEFLDLCQEIALGSKTLSRPPIPVYVGVHRTRMKVADEWLGRLGYASLAASLLVPNEDTKSLPIWIQYNDSLPLWSLGAAMARSSMPHRESGPYPEWIAQSLTQSIAKSESGARLMTTLIDYTALPLIVDSRLRIHDRSGIESNRHRFEDSLVLFGNADPITAQEKSFVPHGSSISFPGIYFHASVAHTMVGNDIYELTLPARLFLDVGFSIVVCALIYALRLRYADNPRIQVDTGRLGLFMFWVATLVVITGLVLVRYSRILWDDCFIVAGALLLHGHIEDLLRWMFGSMRDTIFARTEGGPI